MAQAHLPLGDLTYVKSLQVDSPDDNLRAVIRDYFGRFAKSSDKPVIPNRGRSMSQAREANVEESYSWADH